MSEKFTCPVCGDVSTPKGIDPKTCVSRCDICDSRLVYGEPAPRLVVEPSAFDNQAPAFVLKIQDPKTKSETISVKIDPQHAFLLAQSIISMVRT